MFSALRSRLFSTPVVRIPLVRRMCAAPPRPDGNGEEQQSSGSSSTFNKKAGSQFRGVSSRVRSFSDIGCSRLRGARLQ